jgi:hypothetical protein
MLRLRPGLALALIVAAMTLVAVTSPAGAHMGATTRLVDVPSMLDRDQAGSSALVPPTLSPASPSRGIPWPAVTGALLLAALGRRRPRRTLVLAVVLLLAVFAFEDGVHSVHHLLDRAKLAKCAVAAATAHLHATVADDGGVPDVVLPAPVVAMDIGQSAPLARFPSPVQGRAPPPPTRVA